jgi:hypothetical protein
MTSFVLQDISRRELSAVQRGRGYLHQRQGRKPDTAQHQRIQEMAHYEYSSLVVGFLEMVIAVGLRAVIAY